MTAQYQGKLRLQCNNRKILLNHVLYVPSLFVNLLSVPAIVKHGSFVNFGLKSVSVTLPSGHLVELANHSHFSNLYATILPRLEPPTVAALTLKPGTRININKAHQLLGHVSEEYLRKTAKKEQWTLTSKLDICEDCCLAKARQMNVLQDSTSHYKTAGERLYIDISSVNSVSLGGSRFWL